MSPITRRQMLSAGALSALGLTLSGPLARQLSSMAVDAAPAPPSTLLPLPPLSLATDSTLSEDYFLSSEILIDPLTAFVYPIIRSDDSQAAVIVGYSEQNGEAVYGVYVVVPNAGSATGYTNVAMTPPAGFTARDVCGAAGAAGNALMVAFSTGASTVVVFLDSSGAVGRQVAVPVPATTTGPLFTSFFADSTGASRLSMMVRLSNEYQLVIFDPASSRTTAIPLESLPPQILLDQGQFAAGPPAGGLIGALLTVDNGDSSLLTLCYGTTSLALGNFPFVGVDPAAPPIMSPFPSRPDIIAAVMFIENSRPTVAMLNSKGDVVGPPIPLLETSGFTPGPYQAVTWFQDPQTRQISCLLLAGDTVYLQTIDVASLGAASLPVPIQDGVQAMYLPERGLTTDTALLLATASAVPGLSSLSTLGRRSNGAWITTPLTGASPTQYEIDTYRTLITIRDATDLPVPGVELTVTASLDALAFRPTGAVMLPAGVPTTVPTDAWGELCLATPATALYAASFMVAWADGTGGRSTATVYPDGELHTFLAGGGPLNSYSGLSDALSKNAGAGNALPNLPTDSATLAAVSGSIAAAMKAGFAPTNPNASTPFTLSGLGTPNIKASSSVDLSRVGSDPWWDRVKDDVESTWKAVETGVAKVSQVVHVFDHDVNAWSVSLDIAIDNYVSATINYAIKDLRSAAVAVHGIFHALGADITHAVRFLRTLVSDLMKDAKAIGDKLYSWLTFDPKTPGDEGIALAYTGLKSIAPTLHGKFNAAKGDVTTSLNQILADFGDTSGTKTKTTYATTKSTSARTNVRANYLHEKTRSTTVPAAPPSSASKQKAASLATVVSGHSDAATAAGKAPGSLPKYSDPRELLDSLTLAHVVSLVETVIDAMIDLLEDAVDALLDLLVAMLEDLNDALRKPLDDLPLIGDLFKLLGVPADLSLGLLLCYVVGFGAAAAGDVIFDGRVWLPPKLGSTRTTHRSALAGAAPVSDAWQAVIGCTIFFADLLEPTYIFSLDAFKTADVSISNANARAGVALELLVNLASFPFETTAGDELVWRPQPAPNDALVPFDLWLFGFVPGVLDAIAVAASDPATKDFVSLTLPLVDCALGVLLLSLDAASAAKTKKGDARNVAIVGAVFGWLSTVLKVLAFKPIPAPARVISLAFDCGMPLVNAVVEFVSLEV